MKLDKKQLSDKLHKLVGKPASVCKDFVAKGREKLDNSHLAGIYDGRLTYGLCLMGITEEAEHKYYQNVFKRELETKDRPAALKETLKKADSQQETKVNAAKAYRESMKMESHADILAAMERLSEPEAPKRTEKVKVDETRTEPVAAATPGFEPTDTASETVEERKEIIEEETPLWKKLLKWTLIALAILLFIWLLAWALSGPKETENNQIPLPNENRQSTPVTNKCPAPSWQFKVHEENGSNPASQRWFLDGVTAIKNGATPEAGLDEWMQKGKQFRMTYAVMRELAFNKDLTKQVAVGDLFNKQLDYSGIPNDGECATKENQEEFDRMQAAFQSFEVFGPNDERAPKNWDTGWYNSYFSNGQIVQPERAGTTDTIDPNDKSVIFVRRPDGFIFAIRGVCGNIMTSHRTFVEKVVIIKKKTIIHEHEETCKKCKPPRRVTPKDPSKDVGANPNVDSWKKDGGEKHTINYNDGSSDSRGLQTDPKGDAAEAAAKADADNQADADAHEDAKADAEENGGGTVDSDQSHTKSTPPPADW